jgi:Fe-S-cluster-containing dehydrogenase component
MAIKIDALKCTGCMACEMACGYHRDDGFALLSSCIVAYRTKEKKDYFGVLLKREEDLLIARPEGTEIKREACDLCEEMDLGPMCIKFCPFDAISED